MPGYNADSLDACRAALHKHATPGPWTEAIAASNIKQVQTLSAVVSRESPAAACGLEMAALDHIARRNSEPVGALLARCAGTNNLRRVPVNGVIPPGSFDEAMEYAVEAFALGIRCVKLKVGRDLDRELQVATALRAAFGDRLAIRLDANGLWAPDEAAQHLARFAPMAPEFCEQPVRAGALKHFANSPIPWAADESCGHAELDGLLATPNPQLAAVVLKPMALGGALRCIAIAARAATRSVDTVITHFLDGPLGLAYAAELAAALPGNVRTSGLAKHPGLGAWETTPPQVGDIDAGSCNAPGLGMVIHRVPK